MQDKNLDLRLVTASDMDMLFELANDGKVRGNAFHTAAISYEEHREWFENMMKDDSQIQFIMMSGDQAVGQIRLTVNDDSAEIDYSIIPEKRGMGYGNKIIRLIKESVYEKYPSICKLIARVKPSNAASINCLEKNGFREIYKQYEFDVQDYQARVD